MNLPNPHPTCRHFNNCSGCSVDLALSPPPIWQEIVDHFQGLLIPSLCQGPSTEWRCRAKLAVRGSAAHPLIGLFKRQSHEAVSIPFCLVHHPHINEAVERIKHWMRFHHLQPYQEDVGTGEIRYLQFVVERSSGLVQAVFVINCRDDSSPVAQKWHKLLSDLFEEDQGKFWHSIWLNFNGRKTNTIFGEGWAKVKGKDLIWESFGPISVCYQPANFAQANLNLFESLLHRIWEWISPNAKVAEFYAGIGVIGLFIASKCAWVKCEEINPYAESCFDLSRKRLKPEEAAKISFHSGSAEDCVSIMIEADTVIVDPPRKGLSKFFMQALIHSPVKKLIYVSCGWESFKKDNQILLQEGWRLKKLEGYAFFPGSNHIELLACFER
ncbi:class I SAM-dependent RNA methyltransferase [Candidatus Protochlamydia phocaeensis]|uniref:class I SAM-dependent RNA methyltransferase n=1 Tax=Candidatus Protochlamydia phocaeensis TaxID=1414722 RepID=UPI000838D616|nr:class I SAM-dependent RNA methyltransferase [Candidatus Protochlamydia phocaeensis]